MGKFLSDLISLGVEGVFAYSSGKKTVLEAKNILDRLTSGDEEVPAEEFLQMYDLRIHNFDTKQDDIKFVKNWDFEGVYILHNCSRNIYHIGRSGKVLRKIDRTFRGYENQDVYDDWNDKDVFGVRIIRYENSGYSNINLLEKDLVEKYGIYTKRVNEKKAKEHKTSFWKKLFR